MNRIDRRFNMLKNTGEKALVGFVTAGDPNPDISFSIALSMCRAGLDILELGVPFSDPAADGPVIQRASERALQNGMSLASVLAMTRKLRKHTDVPIVLFSYYNPVLAYGSGTFHRDSLSAGADGVLIVDLPLEESDELTGRWPDDALSLIRLVAPTTPADRMAAISRQAAGFVYLVSKTGVTGSDGLDTSAVADNTRLLRSVTSVPICAGFGISTAEDVRRIARVADGVVIGSAFEKIIEASTEDPGLPDLLANRVSEYKSATR